MKFSEHWLRSFVDPGISTAELARVLTMAGIEVESVEPVAPPFDKVIVGRVVEVGKHPNADRLSVCKVDVGASAPLSIVCGAPNVAAGMKAPVALVGARLPGIQIGATTVRGVESNGMLCSARELGLSEDHGGLIALPEDAPVGADVRKALDLDDKLITLKLTPNRGDCLSLRGIAREVSILTGAPLRLPPVGAAKVTLRDKRAIRLQDPAACPRYCGRILRGVNAKAAAPDWMAAKLGRCGLRPVSAIVDVTNFVMLELGQPLHAFDNRMIEGEVTVRRARDGERLKLLNGQTVDLAPDLLLIADERKPLALGGVMGGDESAVSDATTEVFLEAAYFNPAAVAGRARRLGLASDAAFRFERGVDFVPTVEAMERATQLILDICGGDAGPIGEAVAELPRRNPVRLRVSRASKVIGVSFSNEQITELLQRMQLQHVGGKDEFTVTPPSHRFDLQIEEDLIEEVARIYGYDNIPSRAPTAALTVLSRPERRRNLAELKRILVDREYFEVVNFSFVDSQWERDFCGNAEPIALENPIAVQLEVMRSSLMGSLVANLRFNLARKSDRVRVFEGGRCFLRSSEEHDVADPAKAVAGYAQPLRLGGLAYGPAMAEQWGAEGLGVDFYDVKGDVEALLAPRKARFAPMVHPGLHPGRAAAVSLGETLIGWVGELHPRLQQKYELPRPPVLFELDVKALIEVEMPSFSPISNFPPVIRDRAMWFERTVSAGEVLAEMTRNRPAVVHDIRLFDVFPGKGTDSSRKSLAFRVVMQDTARTLTDAEADAAMAQLTELLSARFGAKLRT